MSSKSVQWILRLEGGALKGPVDTAAVTRMIRDGAFTGTEMISRYPDGKWTIISREPEFYDILMEALEGAIKAESRKAQKVMTEETIFMPAPEASVRSPLVPTAPTPAPPPPPPKSAFDPPPEPTRASGVIEMKSVAGMKREQVRSFARKPYAWVAIVVIVGIVFLFSGGKPIEDKISLIAPGKPGVPLSEGDFKKKYASVLAHIEKDSFEDYLEAQNKLVSLVEGKPSDLEVRSVLCLVYKELWPYAKQDANDQRTVSTFSQATRVLDVTSPYGSFCESVQLLTAGRYREARGTVDNLLENFEGFNMRPVVYVLKAELLEYDKDIAIAARYYEKASQDWEKWLKPRNRLGFLYIAQKDYPTAAEWFKRVLKGSPENKAAKIGLGFSEFYGSHRPEAAIKLLSSALNSRPRVPRTLESEGWQVYAEVLLDQGQKREALRAAEKAYKLNPSNDPARQLVLRLGGSDKIGKGEKGQDNEMMLLGEQYVRQGDFLSAQAEFKAAYDVDQKNATAALKAAKCLWQLNQSYEAIEWLNKSIKADPKFVSAYVLQADYLSQRFDFGAAAQALNNALQMARNSAEVFRGLALLEFRKNSPQSAINYANRAVKIYDADIETYILLSKSNLALAQSIRSSLKKDGDRRETAYRDSIRYATKAIELDATNSEAQIAYARMLAATNGTDSGIDYMQNLIKRYNYSTEYRLALCDILKEAERWSDARNVYEQVVETDPRNKKAWTGLGESLKATGFSDKALKAFLNAAVIDPTDGAALFQAGKVYFEGNRYDEALQQFLRVRSLNANFPKANYYAGKAAFALGHFDEALKYVREEKRLNPGLSDSYILNAEIFTAQGAYDACAAEYAQALKLRSGGAELYVKAAECYRQAGSLEIAETMLTLAKERESGYADLYRELGALFEKKGDNAAARQSYRNYLELAPNAADRKTIEARVHRLGG